MHVETTDVLLAWTHQFSWTGWPLAPVIPKSSPPQHWDEKGAAMPSFFMLMSGDLGLRYTQLQFLKISQFLKFQAKS